jgi:poly(3-hydroxybutyrate) depolymerase
LGLVGVCSVATLQSSRTGVINALFLLCTAAFRCDATEGSPILYQNYELQNDLIAPLRAFARWGQWSEWARFGPFGDTGARRVGAVQEMITRFSLSHTRPDFGIDAVPVDGKMVAVREEVALELPFGKLLHFVKDIDIVQPRVIIAAPLSGHFSTLLRATVEVMLRDHDVYITDWANARDVPMHAGRFGIDEYVSYIIRFLEAIGPGGHLLAVCQPCVQVLAAVAVMSEDNHPATPRSMTLMAGPIDTRENPTAVNDLAMSKPLSWFERTVIARVPWRYPGRGRNVYPGFVQLSGFLMMNMDRHRAAHDKLYKLLSNGETEAAARIKKFYDEYFSVLDLTEEFYIETIDRIFQRAELATGNCTYMGRKVDPSRIHRTALLTVEGGRDDICAPGQTAVAHDLCRGLRPHLKRHHFQANVGHYGVFAGKRWEHEIYPVVRNMILAVE